LGSQDYREQLPSNKRAELIIQFVRVPSQGEFAEVEEGSIALFDTDSRPGVVTSTIGSPIGWDRAITTSYLMSIEEIDELNGRFIFDVNVARIAIEKRCKKIQTLCWIILETVEGFEGEVRFVINHYIKSKKGKKLEVVEILRKWRTVMSGSKPLMSIALGSDDNEFIHLAQPVKSFDEIAKFVSGSMYQNPVNIPYINGLRDLTEVTYRVISRIVAFRRLKQQ